MSPTKKLFIFIELFGIVICSIGLFMGAGIMIGLGLVILLATLITVVTDKDIQFK